MTFNKLTSRLQLDVPFISAADDVKTAADELFKRCSEFKFFVWVCERLDRRWFFCDSEWNPYF